MHFIGQNLQDSVIVLSYTDSTNAFNINYVSFQNVLLFFQ